MSRDRADLSAAERAFLNWLDRGDGPKGDHAASEDPITSSWGQLAITIRQDDGRSEYDLCHEADADADPEALERYTDPLDAREIARFDDRGEYRPLTTAPTLATGWTFEGLSGPELVRAVEWIYPATVANWHRERQGDLDVTHWRAAADRQTGIYDVVDDLPAEGVARAAEACCVDGACLKRREWDLDETEELDVDRGDGEFPCREPCSFLVAAAREWATIEREDARTYEFELTPTEREQLAAIVDAVADGRAGEIRPGEFEDPANVYRARYFRAKHFRDGADGE